MLFVYDFLVLESDYVSQDLSPTENWLSSFQRFVGNTAPENVTEDGSVKQGVFYNLLEDFLAAKVWHSHACMSSDVVETVLFPVLVFGDHVSQNDGFDKFEGV